MRSLHTVFLVLSGVSVPLLWLPMLLNGTLADISAAKRHQLLPDGAALKTTYLSISFLDDLISTLVAFFYSVGNGTYLGPQLMLTDLCSTLHIALGWMIIQSLKKGQKPWHLWVPGLVGVLWNAAGAGIVLPLYCLWDLTTQISDTTIPSARAKSLPLAILASSLPFWVMVLPPAVVYSTDSHQTIMAIFVLSPLICVAVQSALASFISEPIPQEIRGAKSGSEGGDNAKFYIKATYLLLALYSAAFHLICIFACIFSSDPSATFSGVYIPNPFNVDHDSPQRLTQAATLFLQYDWVIICLTSVLYSYLLIESFVSSPSAATVDEDRFMRTIGLFPFQAWLSTVITICLVTVMLGPSTVVSLSLWQRERHLGNRKRTINFGGRPNSKCT